ncbi:hypothetical protein BGW38_004320 [Lunasporangiospora selenospora]|uniref:Uncharacterized protein n=1 Tax=Lunasporangiospora selenospora TaxID=979761 RepID=A0A9P6FQN0_9FUNG|nr:hypothetical protein BGW38_004320 [Lunasporangiospora selenospora]
MDDGSFLIPSLDKERWDTRHHSLPSLISRSEHAQINAKISGFAERLLRFTDLKPLTTRLLKPLRPIWLTPQSFLLKDNMPDYEQLSFYPVICLCASQVAQDGMEERDGYLYVQGSGDDEEMWSKGLTPELFWENEDQLLEEGITSQECVERAQEIVRQSRLKSKASNTPKFTPSMEPCSAIHPSPIWIGNNASGRIPESWEAGFDMVINCGAEIMRDPRLEQVQEGNRFTIGCGGSGQGGAEAILCVMQQGEWRALFQGDGSETDSSQKRDRALPDTKNHYYLHLPIAEGKKGQHQLLQMIPIALKAVQDMYEKETAIHSKAEQEPSTVYRPRILVHCQQGMDRSVGISLALLVQHFEETTGEYLSGSLSSRAMDKEMIQRRLFQIMGHRLAARPSRATLKMVNTYFMSPTDPPPAKFKSTGATNQ